MTQLRTGPAICAALIFASSACGDAEFRPLTMNDGPASLSGRVLDANGVAAAGVQVFLVENGRGTLSVRTDAEGYFSIPDAPPGNFELFANGADRGGVLRAMTIYANGDNAAGDLRLGPYRNFPRLVTYSDIDFEERLTAATGELRGPIDALTVMGREASAGHQYFNRDTQTERAIVDIDLSTGEERVEFVYARASRDPELYSGFALVEFGFDGSGYTVTDIENKRELHRGNLISHDYPRLWRHSDGSVLIREKIGMPEDFGPYDERLVRITRDGLEESVTLSMVENLAKGVMVIALAGDLLYYTPNLDCSATACLHRELRSVDLRTLEIRTVRELESIASRLGAVASENGEAIAVPRRRSATEFSVTHFPLSSAGRSELWEGMASSVEIYGVGSQSAVFEVCDPCRLIYASAGRPPVELARADFEPTNDVHHGRLLIREDGNRVWWSVEVESGAVVSWSLDQVTDSLGRLFCDQNAGNCQAEMAEGGGLIAWDEVQAGDHDEVAIADLHPNGTIDVRVFQTSISAPFQPFVRPPGSSTELLFALDAEGLFQLFLGEAGAPIESFREATHLGSRLRTVVSIAADGSAIDYLADDPLTGTQQLFHRELDRSAE